MYGQLPLLEHEYQMNEDDQFEDEITTQYNLLQAQETYMVGGVWL
jgi:hypothetical protein